MRPRERLTEAETERLLAVGEYPRDRLLVRLMVRTGMRLGEAIALQVKDFDLEPGEEQVFVRKTVISATRLLGKGGSGHPAYSPGREISVMIQDEDGNLVEHRGTPRELAAIFHSGELVKMSPKKKAAGQQRPIPFPAEMDRELIPMLRLYLAGKDRDAWVFTSRWGGHQKRLSMRGATKVIKNLMVEARIPLKKQTPHTLRHTYAVDMLRAGVDLRTLQLLMGHSSIDITAIYLQLDSGEMRTTLKRVFGGE